MAPRGWERIALGAVGARPQGGSAGMLFASLKAANSSGGWALAPLPARRGSLIPADTGVTGQAPNRPAERGEVAFAVTRSHPRHCPGCGPGTLRCWAWGGPWVPGRLLGRDGTCGNGRKAEPCLPLLRGRAARRETLPRHTLALFSFSPPLLNPDLPARNFLSQETLWEKKKARKAFAASAWTRCWLPGAVGTARPGYRPGLLGSPHERCSPEGVWGTSAVGEAPRSGQRPRRQRQPHGFGEGECKAPGKPLCDPPSRRWGPPAPPASPRLAAR